MKLTTTNRQLVDETPYGVYMWQIPSGEFLSDGDGHFMLIFTTRGNREDIQKLAAAARYYGYPEGKAVFQAGTRPVSDDEYDEQVMREKLGLVPDPLDVGALRDEARGKKHDRA